MKKKSLQVVWAIDALDETESTVKKFIKRVEPLFENAEVEIQPITVLVPDELEMSQPAFYPEWNREKKKRVLRATQSLLSTAKIKGLLEPKVVTDAGVSTSSRVETLLAHAKACSADLIILSTHARTGLSRFFMGSFTETLLTKSDVPVIVVNPRSKVQKKIKSILFPTDFSEESAQAFDSLLGFAKSEGAKVILYHRMANPVDAIAGPGVIVPGGLRVSLKEYIQSEKKKKEALAEAYEEKCEEAGVKFSCKIECSSESISDAVMKYADKKEVGMIALASTKGPTGAFFLGSVSRKIVRYSDKLIWVVHSTTEVENSFWSLPQSQQAAILSGNLIV